MGQKCSFAFKVNAFGLPNICTPMFTAALFTIVKLWKQPNCPSTDEKRTWYTFNGILLCHKKNEIFPSARTWMDLEGIMK